MTTTLKTRATAATFLLTLLAFAAPTAYGQATTPNPAECIPAIIGGIPVPLPPECEPTVDCPPGTIGTTVPGCEADTGALPDVCNPAAEPPGNPATDACFLALADGSCPNPDATGATDCVEADPNVICTVVDAGGDETTIPECIFEGAGLTDLVTACTLGPNVATTCPAAVLATLNVLCNQAPISNPTGTLPDCVTGFAIQTLCGIWGNTFAVDGPDAGATVDAAEKAAEVQACLDAFAVSPVEGATYLAESLLTFVGRVLCPILGGGPLTLPQCATEALTIGVALDDAVGPYYRGVDFDVTGSATGNANIQGGLACEAAVTLPDDDSDTADCAVDSEGLVTVGPYSGDQLGDYTFDVTVYYSSDPTGADGTVLGATTESVVATIVNRAPTLAVIAAKNVVENSWLNFTISGTDPDAADILAYSSTNLPAGATLASATGAFSWKPNLTQSGSYTVNFVASDGNGGSDTESASITVANFNTAPTANAGLDKTVIRNTVVTLTGTAGDADGLAGVTQTWAFVSSSPSGFSAANFDDNGDGTATFMAPAVPTDGIVLTFQFTVNDGIVSASDTVAVTVNVENNGASSSLEITESPLLISVNEDKASFTPPAGTGTTTDYTVLVRHDNGLENLNDDVHKNFDIANFTVRLTGPSGLNVVLSPSATGADQVSGTQRTYTYTLTLPVKLEGGSYTFAATYSGVVQNTVESVLTDSDTFTVVDVAPAVSRVNTTGAATAVASAELFNGLGSIDNGVIAFNFDDANWGGYGGTLVTEMDRATFAVAGGDFTGLQVQVKAPGAGTFSNIGSPDTTGVSLSSLTSPPGDYQVKVLYDGTDLAVVGDDLTLTLSVTVRDAGGNTASADLFVLTIHPSNYGFYWVADTTLDGSAGVAFAAGTVNAYGNSKADPIKVTFTGTQDADAIDLAIADFTRTGGGSLDMGGAEVHAFATQALANAFATDGTVTDTADANGAASLDFAANLGLVNAGDSVYLVLKQFVPLGTAAGSYSSGANGVTVTASPVA